MYALNVSKACAYCFKVHAQQSACSYSNDCKRILGMRLVILTDATHVLIYLKRMLITQHAINYLMHMLSMSLKYKIQNPKYHTAKTKC